MPLEYNFIYFFALNPNYFYNGILIYHKFRRPSRTSIPSYPERIMSVPTKEKPLNVPKYFPPS